VVEGTKMLISLCLVLTESSITTNIVMQSRMKIGLSASDFGEECTCHSHRLQGKLLLPTDSVVNIGHSVLAFLLTFTASVNIVYVFCLRRMACGHAVYRLILGLVFPAKNT
jgi:hypothetical protein